VLVLQLLPLRRFFPRSSGQKRSCLMLFVFYSPCTIQHRPPGHVPLPPADRHWHGRIHSQMASRRRFSLIATVRPPSLSFYLSPHTFTICTRLFVNNDALVRNARHQVCGQRACGVPVEATGATRRQLAGKCDELDGQVQRQR
jgi:hypothetical protein